MLHYHQSLRGRPSCPPGTRSGQQASSDAAKRRRRRPRKAAITKMAGPMLANAFSAARRRIIPPISRKTGLLASVQRLLADHSIEREFAAEQDLRDVGLTSLDMASLILSVEAEFDLMIPERLITPANFRSVSTDHRACHLAPRSRRRRPRFLRRSKRRSPRTKILAAPCLRPLQASFGLRRTAPCDAAIRKAELGRLVSEDISGRSSTIHEAGRFSRAHTAINARTDSASGSVPGARQTSRTHSTWLVSKQASRFGRGSGARL